MLNTQSLRSKLINRSVPWFLWLGSFLVYLGAEPFLASTDIRPNVGLAFSLANQPTVWPRINPETHPWAFYWNLTTPWNKIAVGTFSSWDSVVFGKSFLELQREGKVKLWQERHFVVPAAKGGYASSYGPIPPLLGAPFAWALKVFVPKVLDRGDILILASRWISSFLMATASSAIFLAASDFVSTRQALLIATVFAFGSCAWSILSQGYWQQTAVALFLSLGLLAYLRGSGKQKPFLDWICGVLFGLAGATRISAMATLSCTVVYELVLCKNWKKALRMAVASSFPLIGLLAYNKWTFGKLFDFGQLTRGHGVALSQTGQSDLWSTPLLTGISGLLFSPGRGLFVYSPVAVYCVGALFFVFRQKGHNPLKPIAAAFCIHLVVAAKWFGWWGGWTYGYRLLADSLPLLVLPLVFILPRVLEKRVGKVLFGILLLISVGIQGIGAELYDKNWNITNSEYLEYTRSKVEGDCEFVADIKGFEAYNIDDIRYRSRLWDWSECPIWYYLKNFRSARKNREAGSGLDCFFEYFP